MDGLGGVTGAGSRNRTRDLLITNQLLYQLSYAGNLVWLRTTFDSIFLICMGRQLPEGTQHQSGLNAMLCQKPISRGMA